MENPKSRLGHDSQLVADLYVEITFIENAGLGMGKLKRALIDERSVALKSAIDAVNQAETLEDAQEAVKEISWMFPQS